MNQQTQAQPTPSPISQNPAESVFKKLPKISFKGNLVLVLGGILVVLLGVVSGYLILNLQGKKGAGSALSAVKTAKEAGLADEATFKDSAEGKLEAGGIAGEGTHHLVRDGGPSQNVYLTSTVIDLESFAGKKVQVWGQTISARKAGWLMDVGKIKIVD